jgi:hypothetical protein
MLSQYELQPPMVPDNGSYVTKEKIKKKYERAGEDSGF